MSHVPGALLAAMETHAQPEFAESACAALALLGESVPVPEAAAAALATLEQWPAPRVAAAALALLRVAAQTP